jgi:malate dehydrogenase (oxaloacetate-decarboxylating)
LSRRPPPAARNIVKQHSPSYSTILRLRYPDLPGVLGRICSTIGEADGLIGSVDIVQTEKGEISRDIIISARDVEHGKAIVERVGQIPGVTIVRVADRTFLLHHGGKIEIRSKAPVKTRDDLSMVYTPGVARVCRAIAADPEASFSLTIRKNMVAVVSDGSAVLGLGNIGPRAAMPVMEGKCMLFKEFGGVDAFPICLDTQDVDEIVKTVAYLAPTFGGINLEDISSPRCVEVEQRLIEQLDIPVFHDDQHGTAVVVSAALQNALKVVEKKLDAVRVTILGAGAAGAAIAKLLISMGCRQIVLCDRKGAISRQRGGEGNPVKQWIAENTNPEGIAGSLADAMRGADVFIGVSGPDLVSVEDIKLMASDPVVFALANPDPEIEPEAAMSCARVVATGRSDYPNQINNVLCFPGLFRGMLDVRALRVTEAMKIAATRAIAAIIPDDHIRPDYIIPSVFDKRVAADVAKAVANAAVEGGVAAGNGRRTQ